LNKQFEAPNFVCLLFEWFLQGKSFQLTSKYTKKCQNNWLYKICKNTWQLFRLRKFKCMFCKLGCFYELNEIFKRKQNLYLETEKKVIFTWKANRCMLPMLLPDRSRSVSRCNWRNRLGPKWVNLLCEISKLCRLFKPVNDSL
jgi:hypothetical protein